MGAQKSVLVSCGSAAVLLAAASGPAFGRPVERIEFSVNVTNIFDANAVTGTRDAALPAGIIALARTQYGRITPASVR